MSEINTTKRHSEFCRAVAKDGRVCAMYKPHEGKHKTGHGTENDRWEDGE